MKIIVIFTLSLTLLFGAKIIDIKEAQELYSTNSALFIDAREFTEYEKGTIAKALNVPLKRYKRMKKWLPIDKNATIVLFDSNKESVVAEKLAKKLVKLGYKNLFIFKGGVKEWQRYNLPIMVSIKKCQRVVKSININGVEIKLQDDGIVESSWIAPIINSKKLSEKIALIDVRTQAEYKKAHLKGAINIPFNKEEQTIDVSQFPKEKVIFFYCNRGSISLEAYDTLDEEIQKKVFILQTKLRCRDSKCRVEPY